MDCSTCVSLGPFGLLLLRMSLTLTEGLRWKLPRKAWLRHLNTGGHLVREVGDL